MVEQESLKGIYVLVLQVNKNAVIGALGEKFSRKAPLCCWHTTKSVTLKENLFLRYRPSPCPMATASITQVLYVQADKRKNAK